jgi:RNA polymerase sigma-70 factor (ECF subfamily)
MGSHPVPDTEELLGRAERGDVRARSELLDRHRARLRRMVAVRLDRRLLARVDPSDIVQETLAKADRKLAGYLKQRPVPFYPWLRRLAWEQLVKINEKHLHAGRRSVTIEKGVFPPLPGESALKLADRLVDSGPSPHDRLVRAEMKARAIEALAELSERDREILVLLYLEQLSNRDVAELLGVSDAVVRQRHGRALERLARMMKEQ